MSLSEGDQPTDEDVWFRILTQENYVRKGRVHHSAFGGNAIAPPKKDRRWDRELSGRLRSMAGSLDEITNFAEKYCEALTKRGAGKATFSGVMYVRVATAKAHYNNSVTTAVYYTPITEEPHKDTAHADFTFTGWIGDNKADWERLTLWLSDLFTALHHPGQLKLLLQVEKLPPAPNEASDPAAPEARAIK